jgi:hypothetical protein
MSILTGKTIGQLISLSAITDNTLFPVEFNNKTYHIPYLGVKNYTTGGTYSNTSKLVTFSRTDGATYVVDLSTIDTNDTFVTGGTNNNSTSDSPNASIDLLYNQDILPGTYSLPYSDVFITGYTYENNNFTLFDNSGNTYQATIDTVTGLTINGNLDISGNTNQIGNYNTTGNTNQYGNVYISGTSLSGECALFVDGNVCIEGDLTVTGDTVQYGDVFISGDLNYLGDLNITGSTNLIGSVCIQTVASGGTACLDTSLIPSGTTDHQFQNKDGVLAHLGDLTSGEPNSKGYLYMENNLVGTTMPTGTAWQKISGTTSTIPEYLKFFTTGSSTNQLLYTYTEATGSTISYLKYAISYTVQSSGGAKRLSLALRRTTSGGTQTIVPAAMTLYTSGANLESTGSITGIVAAKYLDSFDVVISNGSGAPTFTAIVSDLSVSLFT